MQGPGSEIHLLTSVRSRQRLSDRQVAQLYRARWGIEVFYRHLKQTCGRRKLLSQRAEHAEVELQWSLIALWGMGLYASQELVSHGIPLQRLSMAGGLIAFRQIARDYFHPADPRHTLCIRIRESLLDKYQRTSKKSRDYPRRKHERSPGPPTVNKATRKQPKRLQEMLSQTQLNKKG